MKILLLIPPNRFQSRIHLGLGYIAGFLEKNGYTDIKIFDLYNTSIQTVEKIMRSEKPDVCGISCLTDDRAAAFLLAKQIKEINKDILIIFGNIHASVMWEQLLTHYSYIDLIVRNEGERVMLNIVEAYKKNGNFEKIKGAAYRKNGRIYCNEDEPMIENLDQLPFPAYHLLKLDDKKIYTIMTSRGCPYKCVFCSNSHFWGSRWRARSVENVISEIDLLVNKYNMKFLTFEDDYFIFDQERAIEICKEIINRNYNFSWDAKGRVDNVADGKFSNEMFGWMEKAGCTKIAFGIESGSPTILKNISKHITPRQIIKAYGMLTSSCNIKPAGTFMVGNPGENEQTVNESIQLLKKLPIKKDQFKYFSISMALVYPGTRLYDIAKQNEFLNDEFWLTDNVAPPYTAELSLNILYNLKQRLNLAIFSRIGILSTIKYILNTTFPKRSGAKSKNNIYKLLMNIIHFIKRRE